MERKKETSGSWVTCCASIQHKGKLELSSLLLCDIIDSSSFFEARSDGPWTVPCVAEATFVASPPDNGVTKFSVTWRCPWDPVRPWVRSQGTRNGVMDSWGSVRRESVRQQPEYKKMYSTQTLQKASEYIIQYYTVYQNHNAIFPMKHTLHPFFSLCYQSGSSCPLVEGAKAIEKKLHQSFNILLCSATDWGWPGIPLNSWHHRN